MNEIFEIGKIVNVHGIKGEVKIYPYTDNVELFSNLQYLIFNNKQNKIKTTRIHKNMALVLFENINNRNEAEKLINIPVFINRKDATPLKEGAHYIQDLIGCIIYENNNILGEMVDIIKTGSNDVYVVKTEKNDILIPALKSVVKKIDIDNKKIDVILPEGLIADEII